MSHTQLCFGHWESLRVSTGVIYMESDSGQYCRICFRGVDHSCHGVDLSLAVWWETLVVGWPSFVVESLSLVMEWPFLLLEWSS